MAKFTISAIAAITGTSYPSGGGAFTVECDDYLQFERIVGATSAKVFDASWSFLFVRNSGSVDAIVQPYGAVDYNSFSVPAGKHVLLPGMFKNENGSSTVPTSLFAYTASGETTLLFAIGTLNIY